MLRFTRERLTKNTVRYDEDGPDDQTVVGKLYVQKVAFGVKAGDVGYNDPEAFPMHLTVAIGE